MPLPWSTFVIAGTAVLFELSDVPANGFPSLDLSLIVGASPTHVVTAVPLEPAARVVVIDPSLGLPNGKRLGGVDAEKVQLGIMTVLAKFGIGEPTLREFVGAIGHVSPAENAEFEHLLWREIGTELRMKLLPTGSVNS